MEDISKCENEQGTAQVEHHDPGAETAPLVYCYHIIPGKLFPSARAQKDEPNHEDIDDDHEHGDDNRQ
ncbi:MAG: hypothetical protein ACRENP_21150 [Longimicrobiales bacterium]